MKWIKTHHGDRAHVVVRRSTNTLCGIALKDHANAIVIPGPPAGLGRCANCDEEWRRLGRKTKPKMGRERDLTEYRPVYKIEDWEEL